MNRFKTNAILAIAIVSVIICSFVFFLRTLSQEMYWDTIDESTAILPKSLQAINAQAFLGTAFKSVKFNGQLVYIGDEAFQSAGRLHTVYIPENTNYIGLCAFPLNTIIHVAEDSYAEAWAEENGYQFIVDTLMDDKIVNREIHGDQLLILIILVILFADEKSIKKWEHLGDVVKSMRPQDRPELYPIDYRFP